MIFSLLPPAQQPCGRIHIADADDDMPVIPFDLHADINRFSVDQQAVSIDYGSVLFDFFQQPFPVHSFDKPLLVVFINIGQGILPRF